MISQRRQLVSHALPGKRRIHAPGCGRWHVGLFLPYLVNGVALDHLQRAASTTDAGVIAIKTSHCHQSGINADDLIINRMFIEPIIQPIIRQGMTVPIRRASLRLHLQSITSVTKQRSCFGGNHGKASRAGKSGNIGKTFVRRRHLFALIHIFTTDDKPVELMLCQLLAKALKACG